MPPGRDRRFWPLFVQFVRWWLPGLVVGAGLIAIVINPTLDGLEGASHIIGAGLAILLLNLLVRVGISGDRDRDEEDAARAFFDEHGHWPDEPPPAPREPRRQRPAPPQHRAAPPHHR
jgi:hypothetical protein